MVGSTLHDVIKRVDMMFGTAAGNQSFKGAFQRLVEEKTPGFEYLLPPRHGLGPPLAWGLSLDVYPRLRNPVGGGDEGTQPPLKF